MSEDIQATADELDRLNAAISITERAADTADDGFAWRPSLQGLYGLRAQLAGRLEAALRSDDEAIRAQAVRAFGKAGTESAVPTLAEALRTGSRGVQRAAIRALAEIGDEGSVSTLSETVLCGDDAIRPAVALALGWIGSDASVEALSKAARDPSLSVRLAATEALRMVGTPLALAEADQALGKHVEKTSAPTAGAPSVVSEALDTVEQAIEVCSRCAGIASEADRELCDPSPAPEAERALRHMSDALENLRAVISDFAVRVREHE